MDIPGCVFRRRICLGVLCCQDASGVERGTISLFSARRGLRRVIVRDERNGIHNARHAADRVFLRLDLDKDLPAGIFTGKRRYK